jgi:murein DD-endopeptidase MepM/ murein hydrolase activator NlpD
MPPARFLARFLCAVLLACVSAGFAAAPAAAVAHWQRPVGGPVTRAFAYGGDPFAAGRHRGADFAAQPGAPVRSACSGRVVFAGVAGANGPTVSVRCGRWRVAYLPLRTLAVRRGARVSRGALLGTAAASARHAGLHVGVRREGSRWGYVDPLGFFGEDGRPPLAPGPRALRPPRAAPRAEPLPPPARRPLPLTRVRPLPAPRPSRPLPAPPPDPLRSGRPVEAPARLPSRPLPAPPPDPLRPERPVEAPARLPSRQLAPWPAWAGLALVLGGAGGAGLARRRAPRRRPGAVVAPVARE